VWKWQLGCATTVCFALSYDPKVSQLMAQLNLPGWDLAQLPDDPNLISQTWLEHYANGDPLTSDQIQSLVDRALMHRDLLTPVLSTNRISTYMRIRLRNTRFNLKFVGLAIFVHYFVWREG
jgi:hypothetical protein